MSRVTKGRRKSSKRNGGGSGKPRRPALDVVRLWENHNKPTPLPSSLPFSSEKKEGASRLASNALLDNKVIEVKLKGLESSGDRSLFSTFAGEMNLTYIKGPG